MKTNTRNILFIVFVLLAALGGGVFGSYITSSRLEAALTEGGNGSLKERVYLEESKIIDTVEAVSPSVVSITISKNLPLYRSEYMDPFFNFGIPFEQFEQKGEKDTQSQQIQIGGGSGFIVSSDGLVVTNRHVVEDEEAEYTVITNDGREFKAEVLARDTLTDFAVIKLLETGGNEVENLPFVELGDSETLQIGQKVVAIGNALSEFQNTVTSGIISGMGRDITAGSMQRSEHLINLIQTDAAINPGNSGGPLVNLEGQVVAINTAIAATGQGIGFAIPINDVKKMIENVRESGKLLRPFLGVRFMPLDEEVAKELQIEVKDGALLIGGEGESAIVSGSPADKAGLKTNDVILEVDGQKVTLENPLDLLLSKKTPGDEIKLKIWREGKEIDRPVTLGEAGEIQ